jgi:hypothetical protein
VGRTHEAMLRCEVNGECDLRWNVGGDVVAFDPGVPAVGLAGVDKREVPVDSSDGARGPHAF